MYYTACLTSHDLTDLLVRFFSHLLKPKERGGRTDNETDSDRYRETEIDADRDGQTCLSRLKAMLSEELRQINYLIDFKLCTQVVGTRHKK